MPLELAIMNANTFSVLLDTNFQLYKIQFATENVYIYCIFDLVLFSALSPYMSDMLKFITHMINYTLHVYRNNYLAG